MGRFFGCNFLLAAAVSLSLPACVSAPPRLDAVPAALTAAAEIPGMPGVRYVAGGDMSPSSSGAQSI